MQTAAAPVVIEGRGITKTFRIPDQRIDSLKERALRPLTRVEYRELQAVRDLSFDVHSGEFFGVVGRNGSGKSTLLKLLASIYAPTRGRIRTAGRVAPFIELGVGFNPELTARENVRLNGVLMGLSRRESSRRLDAVLDFAELNEFVEVTLKNYSSGMLVRLAFAVMVQADADIMLIDEVLAVGDAAFAKKCLDVFTEKKESGKTIVLVTHDMSTVQAFCHRAMLLDEGQLRFIGEAGDAAVEYLRLNRALEQDTLPPDREAAPEINARLVSARIDDEAGASTEVVNLGEPLRCFVEIEARAELPQPAFAFYVVSASGVPVFGFRHDAGTSDAPIGPVASGQRIRIASTVHNPLLPGSYFITCWIGRDRREGNRFQQAIRVLDFVVAGPVKDHSLVSVPAHVEATVEDAG